MSSTEKGERDVRGDAPAEPIEAKPDGRRSPEKQPDETELFEEGPGPRIFGEGYAPSGGPVTQGNYADPDPNPRGGYGTFNDAGGPGSTRLLGEENRDFGAEEKPAGKTSPRAPGDRAPTEKGPPTGDRGARH